MSFDTFVEKGWIAPLPWHGYTPPVFVEGKMVRTVEHKIIEVPCSMVGLPKLRSGRIHVVVQQLEFYGSDQKAHRILGLASQNAQENRQIKPRQESYPEERKERSFQDNLYRMLDAIFGVQKKDKGSEKPPFFWSVKAPVFHVFTDRDVGLKVAQALHQKTGLLHELWQKPLA